jgi:hypothetical protein
MSINNLKNRIQLEQESKLVPVLKARKKYFQVPHEVPHIGQGGAWPKEGQWRVGHPLQAHYFHHYGEDVKQDDQGHYVDIKDPKHADQLHSKSSQYTMDYERAARQIRYDGGPKANPASSRNKGIVKYVLQDHASSRLADPQGSSQDLADRYSYLDSHKFDNDGNITYNAGWGRAGTSF